MTIWTDALDDIYASDIGVDGAFSILTDPVRVIDKTSGIDVQPLGLAAMPTILPAATVQRQAMVDAGVSDLGMLRNTTLTLNGVTWKIVNHAYRAQPGGELEGEVYLILRQP